MKKSILYSCLAMLMSCGGGGNVNPFQDDDNLEVQNNAGDVLSTYQAAMVKYQGEHAQLTSDPQVEELFTFFHNVLPWNPEESPFPTSIEDMYPQTMLENLKPLIDFDSCTYSEPHYTCAFKQLNSFEQIILSLGFDFFGEGEGEAPIEDFDLMDMKKVKFSESYFAFLSSDSQVIISLDTSELLKITFNGAIFSFNPNNDDAITYVDDFFSLDFQYSGEDLILNFISDSTLVGTSDFGFSFDSGSERKAQVRVDENILSVDFQENFTILMNGSDSILFNGMLSVDLDSFSASPGDNFLVSDDTTFVYTRVELDEFDVEQTNEFFVNFQATDNQFMIVTYEVGNNGYLLSEGTVHDRDGVAFDPNAD